MNEAGRAPALKHLLLEGKLSRVLMGCKGGGVSAPLLGVGAFGACADLPFLHTAPFAHISFWAQYSIAILDTSGLDWFYCLATWHCSALVPMSKHNIRTKH